MWSDHRIVDENVPLILLSNIPLIILFQDVAILRCAQLTDWLLHALGGQQVLYCFAAADQARSLAFDQDFRRARARVVV